MKGVSYNPTFRLLAVVGASSLASSWALVHPKTGSPAVMAVALLLLPVVHLLKARTTSSRTLDALCVLVVVLGVVGYSLDLFWWVKPYDALAHLLATFSVSLGFFVLYEDAFTRGHIVASVSLVFVLGVSVGALWEVFEWFIGGGHGPKETMSDLRMDGVGALVAGLVVLGRWGLRRLVREVGRGGGDRPVRMS